MLSRELEALEVERQEKRVSVAYGACMNAGADEMPEFVGENE
jgi:hypothetical protein